MKNYLAKCLTTSTIATDIGLLVLRVCGGLMIAFGHGISKIPPSEGFIGGVERMGFPAPTFFAWCAALAEFVGGILIALGLLTRPAALILLINLCVAAFVRHANDDFATKEKALLFATFALTLLFTGPGRAALDYAVARLMGYCDAPETKVATAD